MIQVTVRDGRMGRDPALVDENGHGQILKTVTMTEPVEEGQILTLSDGTEVKVIGYEEKISTNEWSQIAFVGDVF